MQVQLFIPPESNMDLVFGGLVISYSARTRNYTIESGVGSTMIVDHEEMKQAGAAVRSITVAVLKKAASHG